MTEPWKQKAMEIGKIVREAARKHPELVPLCNSWMNFARKRHLHRQADNADVIRVLLERHGLAIIAKQDVDHYRAMITSQDEEIKALEHRITTLLN